MKTYTEQEIFFEKFEKDRSRYFAEDAHIILPLSRWFQENNINKNYVGEKYDFDNSYDLNHRIVRQDGKNYVITSDLIPERLNFEIENGIITKQYNG